MLYMMLNITLTTRRQNPCPKGYWKGGSRSYVVIPSKPAMNGTRMKTDPSSQVLVGSIKGKFKSFRMANAAQVKLVLIGAGKFWQPQGSHLQPFLKASSPALGFHKRLFSKDSFSNCAH